MSYAFLEASVSWVDENLAGKLFPWILDGSVWSQSENTLEAIMKESETGYRVMQYEQKLWYGINIDYFVDAYKIAN